MRTSANRYRPIPCVRTRSSCACGLSRRGALSAHPHMHKKTEWGGRWLRGITYYMVRPTRASYIGISQQWRASLTNGNSVTPAQVTSITALTACFGRDPISRRALWRAAMRSRVGFGRTRTFWYRRGFRRLHRRWGCGVKVPTRCRWHRLIRHLGGRIRRNVRRLTTLSCCRFGARGGQGRPEIRGRRGPSRVGHRDIDPGGAS